MDPYAFSYDGWYVGTVILYCHRSCVCPPNPPSTIAFILNSFNSGHYIMHKGSTGNSLQQKTSWLWGAKFFCTDIPELLLPYLTQRIFSRNIHLVAESLTRVLIEDFKGGHHLGILWHSIFLANLFFTSDPPHLLPFIDKTAWGRPIFWIFSSGIYK